MPTLITRFNWGAATTQDNPELARQLSEAYSDTAQCVNTKASVYVTTGNDPPASSTLNSNFNIGDVYVRTDTNNAWMMTSRTTSIAVIWTKIT